jgi:hypothetical protein
MIVAQLDLKGRNRRQEKMRVTNIGLPVFLHDFLLVEVRPQGRILDFTYNSKEKRTY